MPSGSKTEVFGLQMSKTSSILWIERLIFSLKRTRQPSRIVLLYDSICGMRIQEPSTDGISIVKGRLVTTIISLTRHLYFPTRPQRRRITPRRCCLMRLRTVIFQLMTSSSRCFMSPQRELKLNGLSEQSYRVIPRQSRNSWFFTELPEPESLPCSTSFSNFSTDITQSLMQGLSDQVATALLSRRLSPTPSSQYSTMEISPESKTIRASTHWYHTSS